jgi:hypothetical protein
VGDIAVCYRAFGGHFVVGKVWRLESMEMLAKLWDSLSSTSVLYVDVSMLTYT